MFDIGAIELLVIVIVAILVIGPKDMPMAMRTAGRWIGKVRKVSSHFRTGVDAMVREAELEDMEAKWKAQNEAIMKSSAAQSEVAAGEPVMTGPPPKVADLPAERASASTPVSAETAKSVKDVADAAPALPKSQSSAGAEAKPAAPPSKPAE